MQAFQEFRGVNKILVIKLRHIGDVLLTVPVIRALKETFPDASVSVLVNSGTEDVLAGNQLMDELITFERKMIDLPAAARYLKEIRFIKKIRAKNFDMTVDLTGGDRAAILSCVSGAGYRLGWKSGKGFIGKKYCHTHQVEPLGGKHMVLQNLEIVSRSGINTGNLSVDIHIPEKERMIIKETIGKYNITEHDTIVHIHPTSRWLFKCWKDEYMAEITGWIVEQGMKVILTSASGKNEIEKVKKILSLASRLQIPDSKLIDLSGKTSIKQLAAISEISDLFFGVDSAPMHIAAAVNTPTVALFGPSGAFNWGPWDNGSSESGVQSLGAENPYSHRHGIQTSGIHTVIQRDWDCVPCGKDGCNGSKKSKCLEDISPDEVKDIISEKLKNTGRHKC
ncbi:MAG TPA: putative lipopolysaccharide heptosyltransferase III [Nitrospirae bacterium]|nr:lipopolysaccharide core heptosyltransferase RfaQ [bacterium BMS3Abin06]HDH12365.1 putative lipopolysaccharide heptosyltransferase III [Nitrospirota bacterium]HDL20356.1 putative lipopolysaccharide heptosyltransferase III [Nitrospirota bacterium]HDZ01247.1 putative lipopolysaccharide heptosyltransferase III [Nitrospirota bacterium]